MLIHVFSVLTQASESKRKKNGDSYIQIQLSCEYVGGQHLLDRQEFDYSKLTEISL